MWIILPTRKIIFILFSGYVRGVVNDMFPGFSGFGFFRKLVHTKNQKAHKKQANIKGAHYNFWGSTWSGVNIILSFLSLFI